MLRQRRGSCARSQWCRREAPSRDRVSGRYGAGLQRLARYWAAPLTIWLLVGAVVAAPADARAARVTLVVPSEARPGAHVELRGRVIARTSQRRRARVDLSQKSGRRWVRRARTRVGSNGSFKVTLRLPLSGEVVLRAELRLGGRRAGTSPVRRVRVRRPTPLPSAGPRPATPSPPAAQRPTVIPASSALEPEPTAAPPVEPGTLTTSAALAQGSTTGVNLPGPLESVASLAAVERSALGVAIKAVDGTIVIDAPASARVGHELLLIEGSGCIAGICERPFSLRLSMDVRGITAAPDQDLGAVHPSADRIRAGSVLPLGGTQLADELWVTLGTPEQPGTRADAEALADAVGAHVAGGVEEVGVFQLRWTGAQDLAVRREQLESHPDVAVTFARVGVVDALDTRPPEWDPPVKTWHLELIGAPKAWDVRHDVSAPVGIVDEGTVFEDPEDLKQVTPVSNDAVDDHATHVAGLACAAAPGAGAVGVAWGCPIVSAGDGGRTGTDMWLDVVHNAVRVATQGATVINMSIGKNLPPILAPDGTQYNRCGTAADESALRAEFSDGIPLFTSLFRGAIGRNVVWTLAAGNSCIQEVSSAWGRAATGMDNVVTVAAVNANGSLSSFSNFGSGVELAAPGGWYKAGADGLFSTSIAPCVGNALQMCSTHEYMLGTSMAAPVVAGAAALVRAEHHGLTADDIGRCLMNTAGHVVVERDDSLILSAFLQPTIPFDQAGLRVLDLEAAVKCSLATPPGLPGSDGTIVGQGPIDGVMWRIAGGSDGTVRGQPYVVHDGQAHSTVDPATIACLSRRYALRDFVTPSATDPLIWRSESAIVAWCPSSAPQLELPASARNWILRKSSGEAWLLDNAGELEPITTGGAYIACARRYLVLDAVPQRMLDAFPRSAGSAARCQELRITTEMLPMGEAGSAYDASLALSGSVGPVTWTAAGLPAGLALDAAAGAISGVPAEDGVYAVTFTAHDDLGSAQRTLTLRVGEATGRFYLGHDWGPASLSADGRWFAYPQSRGSASDLFIRRTVPGSQEIQVTPIGVDGRVASWAPGISRDGRFIAFSSGARLVATDTDSTGDVYVYDRAQDTFRRAAKSTGLRAGPVSADGRYVLALEPRFGVDDSGTLYRLDLTSGSRLRVDTTASGTPADSFSWVPGAKLSDDGQQVLFSSHASNLDPADPVGVASLYRKNLDTGDIRSLTAGATIEGTALTASSGGTSSADDRLVAFTGYGLTNPNVNGQMLLDTTTGEVVRAGNGNGNLSADGSVIAYNERYMIPGLFCSTLPGFYTKQIRARVHTSPLRIDSPQNLSLTPSGDDQRVCGTTPTSTTLGLSADGRTLLYETNLGLAPGDFGGWYVWRQPPDG
jgi:hypothetical protein